MSTEAELRHAIQVARIAPNHQPALLMLHKAVTELVASRVLIAAAEAYGAAHREYEAATAILAQTPYTNEELQEGNLRYVRAMDAKMAANEALLAVLAARQS